jgi:penicillin-binding protein 2
MMKGRYSLLRVLQFAVIFLVVSNVVFGAQAKRRHHAVHHVVRHATATRRAVAAHASTRTVVHRAVYVPQGPVVRGGPWTEPTYADSTLGDKPDGEDLDVRRAAVEALGPYNGSVVVVDPASGRILSIINQKLALGSGFQPCSTIKVSVALAALSEKVVGRDGKLSQGLQPDAGAGPLE